MAKQREKEAPAFLLGIEILDECMCGKRVRRDDRQQLKLNPEGSQFYRQCASCLLLSDNAPGKKTLSTGNSSET